MSLVMCVPLPGKHIPLVICVPPLGKHMSLVKCFFPYPETPIPTGLDVATCGVANATSFCSVATKFSRLVAYLAPKIGDSLFGKTYTNDNPLSFRKLNPLILKYNSWRPEYLFWRQKMKTWGPACPTTFF